MQIVSPYGEEWQLLTLANIGVRRLWPWGHSIQKIVAAAEPTPRQCERLLIASDYGGNHRGSSHLIYCYLVARGGGPTLMATMRELRRQHLRDSRKMSYKRLDDPARRQALVPFLSAAANLDAHLVAIAVDKRKTWLCTPREAAEDFCKALQLTASWNARPFEAMLRKVHFVAILLSLWSRPYTDVTWITDQDEFVANEGRHDDALQAVARMSSFYITHPMGVFRLNTTEQEPSDGEYEDLCSIPDLAAGMLSEVSTRLTQAGDWEHVMQKVLQNELTPKAELIANWFWDAAMPLRKTMISIDTEGQRFAVRKVSMRDQL